MIDEAEFQKLRKLVERLERERDQATGAIKQLEKTLKKEFKCESLEQAGKLLLKLEKEYAAQEKVFIKQFNRFVKRHRNNLAKLEGVDKKHLRPIPLPQEKAIRLKATREED